MRDQESFNNTNFIKFGVFEILQNKKGESVKIDDKLIKQITNICNQQAFINI